MSKIDYPVGDFLIRVKNAGMARNKNVVVPKTKTVVAVANVLKKIGILDSVKINNNILEATLTFKKKEPVLINIKLISRPGLRIYQTADEIEKKKGPSTLIVSTPKGIVSSHEVKKIRQGGEVIAEVL